jgi:hypothetical protein
MCNSNIDEMREKSDDEKLHNCDRSMSFSFLFLKKGKESIIERRNYYVLRSLYREKKRSIKVK